MPLVSGEEAIGHKKCKTVGKGILFVVDQLFSHVLKCRLQGPTELILFVHEVVAALVKDDKFLLLKRLALNSDERLRAAWAEHQLVNNIDNLKSTIDIILSDLV